MMELLFVKLFGIHIEEVMMVVPLFVKQRALYWPKMVR